MVFLAVPSVQARTENLMQTEIVDKLNTYRKRVNFSQPQVGSTGVIPLPAGLQTKDVLVTVSTRFEGKQRKRDLELAQVAKNELQDLLNYKGYFAATSEDTAKVVVDVCITAVSVGGRFRRFFCLKAGFVKLGISFSINDLTKEGCPILKHGKIAYVDPLEDANFKERCGKDSGEKAILFILPEISRILSSQVF